MCDLCDKVDTPFSKCIDCYDYMCTDYTKGHTRVKMTKDHRIVTDHDIPKPKIIYCESHSEERVSFYCYKCKKLICSICITVDHSDHSRRCAPIKLAAQETSRELSKSLAHIKQKKMADLNLKIREVENKQQENQSNGESNIQIIQGRIKKFVQQFNTTGEKLMQESRNMTKENENYLSKILVSLKTKQSELKDFYTKYHNILSEGSDTEKILASIDSVSKLNENLAAHQDISVHLTKFVSSGKTDNSAIQLLFGSFDDENGSDFHSDVSAVPSTKQSKGPTSRVDAQNGPTLRNPLSKANTLPASGGAKPNLDDKSKYKSLVSVYSNVHIQKSFQLVKDGTKIITVICPINENFMLIHYNKDDNNYIVNAEGKEQGTIPLDFTIYDMAKVNKYIYTTDFDNNKIHKLNANGQKAAVINTKMMHPIRLCASSDGTLLVTMTDEWSYKVNYQSRRYVARLEQTGQEKNIYELDNNGHRLFNIPTSVAENVNGDICVINRLGSEDSNLFILDNNGRLKVIYNGEPTRLKFDAKRVICDKLGHTIITDYVNNSVHLLDVNGQFILYLLTDQRLRYGPCSLALDKYGQLWLGTQMGHVLVIDYINDK